MNNANINKGAHAAHNTIDAAADAAKSMNNTMHNTRWGFPPSRASCGRETDVVQPARLCICVSGRATAHEELAT
jgi:hypothetical protein